MSTQAIWGIARADFRERTRRYSFLVTLLFAVFLGYETATGRILIQLDEYRGVYTSGWIGTLMAMVIGSFVSLIGFYIVKNSVERDRATGVGAILAATPLSKIAYATGKWLSNFTVLSAIVVILAVAAVAMQFVSAEDPHLDLWALLAPFLFLALPAMAVTAAFALLFEMLPGLRGGAGNVLWFFVWSFLLSFPMIKDAPWADPIGFVAVMKSLESAARMHIPGYQHGIAFTIQGARPIRLAEGLHWGGIDWGWNTIALRLVWFVVVLGMLFVASLVFDRFDSMKLPTSDRRKKNASVVNGIASTAATIPTSMHLSVRLTPARSADFASAFSQMVIAELRLGLKGQRWWWYAVAIGLLIAQFVSPLHAVRGPILAVAWLWPALIWSGLGTREQSRSTQQVIFSCSAILRRQFPASWLAGILIAMLCGAGAGMRLIYSGESSGWIAWLGGAVFVPTLALTLGVWSGASKFFEGLYTVLWYVGPMNHAPGFDFIGSHGGATAARTGLVYLGISALLLAFALLRRISQLRTSR